MFKKLMLSLLFGLVFAGKVMAQPVDYYLPYPGILPDHPLYWLKMVRDRVGLLITVGNQAKAEKLLLYADKRLGAAWALVDGNKVPLGVSTLTKAEKYLEQAVIRGGDDSFKTRLGKAILKHREVLLLVRPKVGSEPGNIEAMLMRLDQFKQQFALGQVNALIYFEEAGGEEFKVEATTAYEALEKVSVEQDWELTFKDYDFGKMVDSVNGVANSKAKAWIFYVNGAAGDRAADKFELKAGDKVEWKYEAVKL